jgi:uncharacterized phage protein gp47/JayE
MANLADLIATTTADAVEQAALAVLATAGFPTTSWGAASVPRRLIRAFAQGLADASVTIANIANGGYLDLAENDWLTLLCESVYSETRAAAAPTYGLFSYSAPAAGATLSAGTLRFVDAIGNQFANVSDTTITTGVAGTIAMRCETPGSAGNIATGSILYATSGAPAGVAFSNPAQAGTATWITTAGRDEESDADLRARCRAKWGTIGAGGTADAIVYWALATGAGSAPSVTRAVASADGAGGVTVVLGSATGAPDPADFAAVAAVLELKRPLCSTLQVVAATARPIVVAGTVRVRSAALAAAQAQAAATLQAIVANAPIGGTIRANALVAAIQGAQGVESCYLTSDASGAIPYTQDADITLGSAEVAVLDTGSLSWVSV